MVEGREVRMGDRGRWGFGCLGGKDGRYTQGFAYPELHSRVWGACRLEIATVSSKEASSSKSSWLGCDAILRGETDKRLLDRLMLVHFNSSASSKSWKCMGSERVGE